MFRVPVRVPRSRSAPRVAQDEPGAGSHPHNIPSHRLIRQQTVTPHSHRAFRLSPPPYRPRVGQECKTQYEEPPHVALATIWKWATCSSATGYLNQWLDCGGDLSGPPTLPAAPAASLTSRPLAESPHNPTLHSSWRHATLRITNQCPANHRGADHAFERRHSIERSRSSQIGLRIRYGGRFRSRRIPLAANHPCFVRLGLVEARA